jgi:Uma2 family endonuclease
MTAHAAWRTLPLTAADIKLVIEVADSSWSYDTTEKAAKYAAFGISDYWVIDAVRNSARIHRGPAWRDVTDIATGSKIAPLCAPGASFAL